MHIEKLLNADEAAQMLGMSAGHLTRLARRREIACVRASARAGSPVKFRLSTLLDWIQAHEIKPLAR